jgi:ABC-2 type transport system permease protein
VIVAAIRKDVWVLLRDRGALISLFLLPIIFIVAFGSMFRFGNQTGPLAGITSFQVTVPGNAVLFGFFIALTTAMSYVTERRLGTWRRLLAAPLPRWQALLATLVPYYVVGVAQLTFLFGIGALAFGMQVAGSVAALVVLSLAVVLCAVCLGLVFATFATTERQLGGMASVVLLVMGLLGGCMFPRLIMPATMRRIGLAVPHSWALDGYYDVLVRPGTSIADIAPSLAALLLFATGFAAIGLWRFRFER